MHTRSRSERIHALKLRQLLLVGTQPARGGARQWLISIPIQAHKSTGSRTWCFWEHQTLRGREGLERRGSWSKAQIRKSKYRQVHSPHRDTHTHAGPVTVSSLCVKAHSQKKLSALQGHGFPPPLPPPSSSSPRSAVLLRICPVCDSHARFCWVVARPIQRPGSPMRLEAATRMDLFRKLWKARKLIVVVFIPLSLLPLPLIHPTSVSKRNH